MKEVANLIAIEILKNATKYDIFSTADTHI